MKLILKSSFFSCALLLLVAWASAQVTFNQEMNYKNGWEGSRAVTQTKSGYLLVYNSLQLTNGYGTLNIVQIDSNGSNVSENVIRVNPDYEFLADGIKEINDTTYIIMGSLAKNNPIQVSSFILAINEVGDSLWFQTYDLGHGSEGFEQGIVTNDGNLLHVGAAVVDSFVSYPNPTNDTLQVALVKTDLLGNEIWRKVYPNAHHWEVGRSFVELDNDDIMVLVSTFVGNFKKTMLWRLAPNGIVKWQRLLSSGTWDAPLDLILGTDGFLYLTGYTSQNVLATGNGFVIKADTAANVIWKRQYGVSGKEDFLEKIRLLPDGNIITAGSGWRNSPFVTHLDAMLIKINASNGDTIWQKFYNSDGVYENMEQDYFWALDVCDDGGFIMSGMTGKPAPTHQNAWVVKVDSNGHVDYTTDINDVANTQAVLVYPNPTNGLVNFKGLPKGLKNAKVYSLLGKEVLNQKIDNSINLNKLATGIYLVVVSDKNGTSLLSEKVQVISN